MEPYMRECFGNASEPHWAGREARAALSDARERCAVALGCEAGDVVFCGGGSEADNLAVLGRALGGGRVVASSLEHPAVRNPLLALAARGNEVAWAPAVADGRVDLDALAALVQPGDALCAVIWANNVTGVVQPVAEIAALCAQHAVPLHLDGVQVPCAIDVDLSALPGEVTLALSAHKLHGPKGSGLLAGTGLRGLDPVLHGGGQERGLRPGTEAVAAAAAFACVLERSRSLGGETRAHAQGVRDAYEARLRERLGEVAIAGRDAPRLPGHSLACLDGVRGDTVVWQLDAFGIAASAGSACASGSADPSHVLTAMGMERERALGALRLTFGELNGAQDGVTAAEAVASAVTGLRELASAV
jgi:cysteine desulfurase